MRGFLINSEIFLNMSGEEILFDREMGQPFRVEVTHHRIVFPQPAIDVEHANPKLMNGELTPPPKPKKSRVFLPHTESLPFEKPGAGVDLTFIARFVQIPRVVRCSQPLANVIRWMN